MSAAPALPGATPECGKCSDNSILCNLSGVRGVSVQREAAQLPPSGDLHRPEETVTLSGYCDRTPPTGDL